MPGLRLQPFCVSVCVLLCNASLRARAHVAGMSYLANADPNLNPNPNPNPANLNISPAHTNPASLANPAPAGLTGLTLLTGLVAGAHIHTGTHTDTHTSNISVSAPSSTPTHPTYVCDLPLLGISGVMTRTDPPPGIAELPLVLDSPHSGVFFPNGFKPAAPYSAWMSSVDLHVEKLFGSASMQGASLLSAHFGRCLIDCNRDPDDIDSELLKEPWPTPLNPGEKTKLGLGLLRRFALPGVEMHAGLLSVETVQSWLHSYYFPYHRTLKEILDEKVAKFGCVWHLNCHSMKSVANAMTKDKGKARPDFVLGDRDGTACDPAFTLFIASFLTSRGYTVYVNKPYKGAALVKNYADPINGRHSLLIEVNRRLYLDETRFEFNDRHPQLQKDLDELVAALAQKVSELMIGRGRHTNKGGMPYGGSRLGVPDKVKVRGVGAVGKGVDGGVGRMGTTFRARGQSQGGLLTEAEPVEMRARACTEVVSNYSHTSDNSPTSHRAPIPPPKQRERASPNPGIANSHVKEQAGEGGKAGKGGSDVESKGGSGVESKGGGGE